MNGLRPPLTAPSVLAGGQSRGDSKEDATATAADKMMKVLEAETARAIAVLGNAREVDKYLNRKDKNEEAVNMCEALQEMIWEGEKVGEARGEARAKLMGIKAMIADNLDEGISELRIVEKLQKHFSIDQTEAQEHLRLYHEQEDI